MAVVNSLNTVLRPQYAPPNNLALKETSTVSPIGNVTAVSDTVTISLGGQQMSDAIAKIGVEQYALPSWFMEFAPAFSNLSDGAEARMEEAKQYTAFHEKLAADGDISTKDLEALKSYIDTMMPANTQRKQLEADYNQNRALYNEYGSIHSRYMNEALAEQGIVTQEDWNQKVKNAPGENQELRFSIMEKMFGNPRVMALMNILGIPKPAA